MHRGVVGTALLALALVAAPAQARPTLSSREFSDLKRDVLRALKSGQWSAAASKLREVARDDSKRAVGLCCTVAKVPDAAVYEAAKQAVAAMRSAEVDDEVRSVLGRRGGSAVDKMLLVDAMAERADPFAEEALGLALGAREPEVQRAALGAIKRKTMLGAMDGLIDLLERLEKKDEEGLNANLVRETLQDLTKESFATAEDWRKFWEPRRSNFRRPTTGSARAHEGGTQRRERPKFFGSELKSNRLVFVIDTSGSMTAADPAGTTGRQGPRTGGQPGGAPAGPTSRVRIERAKQQLTEVIEALPEDAHFTIVAYSGVLLQGPSGPMLPPGVKPGDLLPPKLGGFEWLKIWQPKLTAASARAKEDAKAFVAGLQANGGTFTFNALRTAFEIADADTIVVLSDGMPNDVDPTSGQPLTQEQILEQVATLNRFQRRVIDTFGFDPAAGAASPLAGGHRRGTGARPKPAGFGGGSSLGEFMQQLAEQNSGDYTQID